MSNAIHLQDYSKIPLEDVEVCRKLQAAIHAGNHHIVNLATYLDGQYTPPEEGEDAPLQHPRVFATEGNHYCTKKYAGILEYQGRTILINARFDQGDKLYFLRYALETIGMDKLVVRSFLDMLTQGSLGSYVQLLVLLFLRQVHSAYQRGALRQYRTFRHNDSKLRGPMDVARHLRCNPLNNGKIAYSTRDYTLDNPTNQLILSTLAVLEQRPDTRKCLQDCFASYPHLQEPFQQLRWELGAPTVRPSDIPAIVSRNLRPITHPFHQQYESARQLAVMILQSQGASALAVGHNQVSGILLPMDKVWERLLECTLFPQATTIQKEIPILSQQGLPVQANQAWMPRRVLKPDFYAENGSYVVEAKYKKPWGTAYATAPTAKGSWAYVREDVFQVLSYLYAAKTCHNLSAVQVGVAFPYGRNDPTAPLPVVKPFSIFTPGGSDTFHLLPYPVEYSIHYTCYEDYEAAMRAHAIHHTAHLRAALSPPSP